MSSSSCNGVTPRPHAPAQRYGYDIRLSLHSGTQWSFREGYGDTQQWLEAGRDRAVISNSAIPTGPSHHPGRSSSHARCIQPHPLCARPPFRGRISGSSETIPLPHVYKTTARQHHQRSAPAKRRNGGRNTAVRTKHFSPARHPGRRATQHENKLLYIILLLEFLDTARAVHNFLLLRVKRMAVGTNFNVKVFHGRSRLDFIAACALYYCVNIFWMNIRLHFTLYSPMHSWP